MFAKSESSIHRIEVLRPLPPNLNPFDGPSVFLSNGLKAKAARERGIPTHTSPSLAMAMDEAERICHAQHRLSAGVGPHTIDRIPYALVTAFAKGTPAREVMRQEGHWGGNAVVSDVVIAIEQPGIGHTTTAHKLENEKERAALSSLLIGSGGHANIVTHAGLYRFSLDHPNLPGELFLVELDHGTLKRDLNMAVLARQLDANGGTSGNMRTPFILKYLVEPSQLLNVRVSKYREKGKPEEEKRGFVLLKDASGGGGDSSLIEPHEDMSAKFTISAANPRAVEINALGFV